MQKKLFAELGKQFLVSVGIYIALFVALYVVEWLFPAVKGTLLTWHLHDGELNWAFLIGIPASIFGTGYVLTIKNPQNYTGFYPGVLMSILLSIQFYLQGNYDLVLLYLLVFVPFQLASLYTWRKSTLHPENTEHEEFTPRFLDIRHSVWAHLMAIAILVLDYVIVTKVINHDGWGDNIVLKITTGLTIASSIFANFLLIDKKNDAWICWVIYCIVSIVLSVLIGNMFSLLMFAIMLIINSSAQIAWLRQTKSEDFGWAGSTDHINRLRKKEEELRIQRDRCHEERLDLQEKWLLQMLEQNRLRREKLITTKRGIFTKAGHIVDVVNREIFDGELEIRDGKVASIRRCKVAENSPYILPGFVDSHIHIESTLLLPEQFARLAVTQGTIGVIADPHEVANVLGMEGIEMMIKSAKKARFHFHFGASSCVPATGFETSGAHLGPKEIKELLKKKEIYGLGEMMNVPGVLMEDAEVMEKIRLTLEAGKPVDGHCPKLGGVDLQKYVGAGITADHESTTLAEAREKLQAGMLVQIREGSAACDLSALAPILLESDDKVMFCSDDKYPDEIILGYVNDMVVRCIRRGMPLWSVLHAACVAPVRHYGMQCGLLQIGDNADFICVQDLVDFSVQETYINGRCVFKDHHCTDQMMLDNTPSYSLEQIEKCPNHFLAQPIQEEQIRVPAVANKQLKVIGTTEGSLLTKQMLVTPKIENGMVVADTKQDVLKVVCLSRHSVSTPQVAFIHGFGLQNGAMASTIGHDSHNIIAIGTNDHDIVRAINHLIEIKGGLVICDGEELIDLELHVAGLMSVRSGRQVGKRHSQLKAMAGRMGCRYKAPFMTMAFMPLPVIPELKITDKGLFDATKFEFTSLWAD